jgi:glyoxylase-like metal-dependent hydrolase (beta-lactamase superfamily II)
MLVGDIEVTVLCDGESVMPGHFFGPTDGHHEGMVDEHGRITLPIAAFLLRLNGKNVLLDAGMGPVSVAWDAPNGDYLTLSGGALPRLLVEQGLRPEDIDYVMPTHLHGDHAGWLFAEGKDFFPNAVIRFGEGDWQPWVEDSVVPGFKEGMLEAQAQGRVQFIEGDGELLPGLSAMATPGHTPGHMSYVISSGTERAKGL